MDMRFGTWNVRSIYRAGSLRAIAEEISKYNLRFSGSTGGQMGWRWHRTSRQMNVPFSMEKGMKIMN
jgi:hypothetical protein